MDLMLSILGWSFGIMGIVLMWTVIALCIYSAIAVMREG
jgi:hypothetical protein